MTKFALALLASVAITGTAHAETFEGPYVGVAAVRDAYEIKGDLLGDVQIDGLSANGYGAALYAGYDLPLSANIFAGLEANATLTSAALTLSEDDFKSQIKARESFGFSTRLGYKVTDATGIYARVGYQRTKFKATISDYDSRNSENSTQEALVYGAGLETGLGSKTSLRAEYIIEDYDSATSNSKLSVGISYRF